MSRVLLAFVAGFLLVACGLPEPERPSSTEDVWCTCEVVPSVNGTSFDWWSAKLLDAPRNGPELYAEAWCEWRTERTCSSCVCRDAVDGPDWKR